MGRCCLWVGEGWMKLENGRGLMRLGIGNEVRQIHALDIYELAQHHDTFEDSL